MLVDSCGENVIHVFSATDRVSDSDDVDGEESEGISESEDDSQVFMFPFREMYVFRMVWNPLRDVVALLARSDDGQETAIALYRVMDGALLSAYLADRLVEGALVDESEMRGKNLDEMEPFGSSLLSRSVSMPGCPVGDVLFSPSFPRLAKVRLVDGRFDAQGGGLILSLEIVSSATDHLSESRDRHCLLVVDVDRAASNVHPSQQFNLPRRILRVFDGPAPCLCDVSRVPFHKAQDGLISREVSSEGVYPIQSPLVFRSVRDPFLAQGRVNESVRKMLSWSLLSTGKSIQTGDEDEDDQDESEAVHDAELSENDNLHTPLDRIEQLDLPSLMSVDDPLSKISPGLHPITPANQSEVERFPFLTGDAQSVHLCPPSFVQRDVQSVSSIPLLGADATVGRVRRSPGEKFLCVGTPSPCRNSSMRNSKDLKSILASYANVHAESSSNHPASSFLGNLGSKWSFDPLGEDQSSESDASNYPFLVFCASNLKPLCLSRHLGVVGTFTDDFEISPSSTWLSSIAMDAFVSSRDCITFSPSQFKTTDDLVVVNAIEFGVYRNEKSQFCAGLRVHHCQCSPLRSIAWHSLLYDSLVVCRDLQYFMNHAQKAIRSWFLQFWKPLVLQRLHLLMTDHGFLNTNSEDVLGEYANPHNQFVHRLRITFTALCMGGCNVPSDIAQFLSSPSLTRTIPDMEKAFTTQFDEIYATFSQKVIPSLVSLADLIQALEHFPLLHGNNRQRKCSKSETWISTMHVFHGASSFLSWFPSFSEDLRNFLVFLRRANWKRNDIPPADGYPPIVERSVLSFLERNESFCLNALFHRIDNLVELSSNLHNDIRAKFVSASQWSSDSWTRIVPLPFPLRSSTEPMVFSPSETCLRSDLRDVMISDICIYHSSEGNAHSIFLVQVDDSLVCGDGCRCIVSVITMNSLSSKLAPEVSPMTFSFSLRSALDDSNLHQVLLENYGFFHASENNMVPDLVPQYIELLSVACNEVDVYEIRLVVVGNVVARKSPSVEFENRFPLGCILSLHISCPNSITDITVVQWIPPCPRIRSSFQRSGYTAVLHSSEGRKHISKFNSDRNIGMISWFSEWNEIIYVDD